MSTPERATVRIVSDGGDNVGGPAPAHQPGAVAASTEPEAQPPITPPLAPQEFEPDLGGPALTTPTPEQLVEAAGGSVADRLRARFEAIASTEEFAVPGWELPNGEPGLVIVARTFGDRKAFNTGVSNEVFIAKSTHQLLFVEDDGTRRELQGGWGPGLAQMMGVSVAKAADLVALVISKPDPSNPGTRIPNVAGIAGLATEIVNWARKGSRDAEEDLGE